MTKKKPVKKKAATPEGVIFTVGKRRRAVARATLTKGRGIVKLNSVPIERIQNPFLRLRLQEPFILVGEPAKQFDISVNASGGGALGQVQAARQAIARGLAEALGDEVKNAFLSYDRHLLAYDFRRTEPHKPPRSSQGPRRYKQRSKR